MFALIAWCALAVGTPEALVPAPANASPRQLFNLGLAREQAGDRAAAFALYLRAAAAEPEGVGERRYVERATARLVAGLAGLDDDAAAAVAFAAPGEAAPDPLRRSLLRRFGDDLRAGEAEILAARVEQDGVLLELAAGPRSFVVYAPRGALPYGPGHAVRYVIRRASGRALAGWRLVALGEVGRRGFGLVLVDGAPSEENPAPRPRRLDAPRSELR